MKDKFLSLYELNSLVKDVLDLEFSSMYWIVAETSDVRRNQNGHCYLELLQKDSSDRNIVAKARAMIWSNTYMLLKPYFEETTRQQFSSGIKVLIQVKVGFHELYGYSLTIHDIDPSYTLGDQAQKRAAIIKQLEEDGILELNKELELSQPLQRLAIISSPTAAGYEDFCNQLDHNNYGFIYYKKLFPAIMQGENTETSVSNALDQIFNYLDCFDAVVIIRGGGASSELASFDSYLLASSCAQFPLPILVGIGHDRDQTVLDLVAHTSLKTPTAVAEFVVNETLRQWITINEIGKRIKDTCTKLVTQQNLQLNKMQMKTTIALKNRMQEQVLKLQWYQKSIVSNCTHRLKDEKRILIDIKQNIASKSSSQINAQSTLLDTMQKHLKLLSPENLLKKGYTYTLKDKKLVTSKEQVASGDKIQTIFADGEVTSIVK